MNIRSLTESKCNVAVTVSISELQEFGRSLIAEAIEVTENRMNKKEDKLYTVAEVCELLGKDRSTLNRWHRANYLRPVYVGRQPKYKQSDLDKIMGRA